MPTEIQKCRICGNTKLTEIIDLGIQPLSGIFPKSISESVSEGRLKLLRCESSPYGCGLVQLSRSFDLDQMYGMQYGYRSGLNSSMVRHLQSHIKKLEATVPLGISDYVLDIGSNDGTTLSFYSQAKRFGIDPTIKKFSKYYEPDIVQICDFFPSKKLDELLNGKKLKAITSFSMFYDLEDPVAFAKGIYSLLDDDGVWVTEQSYLPLMLEANSYDTICHEHLEYYTLSTLEWIAREAKLKIIDIETNDVNGGSISVVMCKEASNKYRISSRAKSHLQNEKDNNLVIQRCLGEFAVNTINHRVAVGEFFSDCKTKGQRVAGLGASTKGNILLNYCGLDSFQIEKIGEINPDKFSSFTPGSLIPICPEELVLNDDYDFYFVLPWHFKDYFINSPKYTGKSLVFPLPHFEIVNL